MYYSADNHRPEITMAPNSVLIMQDGLENTGHKLTPGLMIYTDGCGLSLIMFIGKVEGMNIWTLKFGGHK